VWTVYTEPNTIRGRRDCSVDGIHRSLSGEGGLVVWTVYTEHYQGKEEEDGNAAACFEPALSLSPHAPLTTALIRCCRSTKSAVAADDLKFSVQKGARSTAGE